MEDHHVDRLGVEVQQCMKLTSTNRSIGLIALIVSVHPSLPYSALRYLRALMDNAETRFDTVLRWPGDIGGA